MKKFVIAACIICLFSHALFPAAASLKDPLAADVFAARYRTGRIDPAIENIPEEIRTNIFIKPEIYLKKLVFFLTRNADNDYHVIKRIHDFLPVKMYVRLNPTITIIKLEIKISRSILKLPHQTTLNLAIHDLTPPNLLNGNDRNVFNPFHPFFFFHRSCQVRPIRPKHNSFVHWSTKMWNQIQNTT